MADEFLSGVQIGGNLANLGQMRAERMMQLRAQQAMQAIQERHLAAQADLLTQQTAQVAQNMKLKEEQDREEQAATLVGASHLGATLEQMGTSMDQASPEQMRQALSTTLPVVGLMPHGDKVAENLGNMAWHLSRAEKAGATEEFTPHVGVAYDENGKPYHYFKRSPNTAERIDTGDGNGNVIAKPVLDEQGNPTGLMGVPGPKGIHYFSPKTGASAPLSTTTKKDISEIYSQIRDLQKTRDQLVPEGSFKMKLSGEEGVPNTIAPHQLPNTVARMRLSTQIAALKERAKALEASAGAPTKNPKDAVYEVGKKYVDENGKFWRYKGNDNWEEP